MYFEARRSVIADPSLEVFANHSLPLGLILLSHQFVVFSFIVLLANLAVFSQIVDFFLQFLF